MTAVATRRRLGLDLAGIAFLLIVAFLLRSLYLQEFPYLRDEDLEITWAVKIAQGGPLPLTANVPYIGPLHSYVVAAALKIFGFSLHLPRTVVMFLSVLTIIPTYLLGRWMGGRLAGWMAGAFTATSFPLVFNSHIAWSNCTTPFYTTIALALLYWSVKRERPAGFVASAFFLGLALQTHPSVLAFVPGAILWMLAQPTARRWFRRRWVWLALVAAIVATGPLLYYNLTHDFEGLTKARRRSYAFEEEQTPASFLDNSQSLVLLTVRGLSVRWAVDEWQGRPTWGDLLREPLFLFFGLTLLGGVLYAARRGATLPLLIVSTSYLVIPVFNQASHFPGPTRYVAPLLPLGMVALAMSLSEGMARGWRELREIASGLLRRSRATALLGSSLLIALAWVSYPPTGFVRYYNYSSDIGATNAPLLAMVDAIKDYRPEGTPVYLDNQLKQAKLYSLNVLRVATYYLLLEQIPTEVVSEERMRDLLQAEPDNVPVLLVLTTRTAEALKALATLELVQKGGRVVRQGPGFYGLYRSHPR